MSDDNNLKGEQLKKVSTAKKDIFKEKIASTKGTR